MKKFFGNYQTSGDVQTALDNGTLSKPYVALVGGSTGTLDYNTKSEIIHYENMYFTIQALEEGHINFNATAFTDTLYHSYNGAEWSPLDTSSPSECSVYLNQGDELRLKTTVTGTTSYSNMLDSTSIQFNVYGNILSLFYGDNFSDYTTLPNGNENALDAMFQTYNVVDAGNLILPSPQGENEITYKYMFQDCTGLTTAPAITQAFVYSDCCMYMYNGCTSLTYIKCLAYNSNSSDWGGAFPDWVVDVPSGGTFVKSVDANEWMEGPSGIPEGWTVESI